MKKLLIKLIIFAIFSSFLSLSLGPIDLVANAENGDDAQTETEEAAEFVRIIADLEKGDNKCFGGDEDEGYIVTILEEPLSIPATQRGEVSKDRIIERPCFRHVYRADKTTHSALSTEPCANGESEKLRQIAAENENKNHAYSCKAVLAILSKGGTALLYHYIGTIYRWGVSMVGVVAVLVIVISGIQISAAGGDPEKITSAKRRILQSFAGIAVLILSGLILYTINPDFFVR